MRFASNVCFAAALVIAPTVVFAQSSDSQTLQALLQEFRQFRQEMQRSTAVAQRVQAQLYRLQLQDDTIKKAIQSHEQAVAKVADAERARILATNGQKLAEEKLTSLRDENQRPIVAAEIREMKRRSEMWNQDVSNLRAAEIAAADDLNNEQVKLVDLQQRLDRVEQELERHSSQVAR